ncbi:MAG TPA: hypothetical protein VH641_00840 [Streptosporangiaceae bacterium]
MTIEEQWAAQLIEALRQPGAIAAMWAELQRFRGIINPYRPDAAPGTHDL